MKDIFPKGSAQIDGEFIKLSEAKISILDWGFLRSDVTYDVVHVWKSKFFQLDKHIDRFFKSTEKLRMPCKLKREDLKKGSDVLLTNIKKTPPSSVDPTIKNYHWMDLVTGMLDAYEREHHTALLVDVNNNISEGPGFNIFLCRYSMNKHT